MDVHMGADKRSALTPASDEIRTIREDLMQLAREPACPEPPRDETLRLGLRLVGRDGHERGEQLEDAIAHGRHRTR
jgi:hypothetical protein